MRSSVLAACVVAASFGLGAAISEAGFGPAQGLATTNTWFAVLTNGRTSGGISPTISPGDIIQFNGTETYTLASKSGEPAAAQFLLANSSLANPDDPARKNAAWFFGYNITAGGGPLVPTEPANGWSCESYYAANGHHLAEQHSIYYSVHSNQQFRPYSWFADRDTDEIDLQFVATKVTLNSPNVNVINGPLTAPSLVTNTNAGNVAVQICGTTSSFPGIRNTGSRIEFVSADNSAWIAAQTGEWKTVPAGVRKVDICDAQSANTSLSSDSVLRFYNATNLDSGGGAFDASLTRDGVTANTVDFGTGGANASGHWKATNGTLSGALLPSANGVPAIGAAANGFKAVYLDYTNTGTVGNVTINKASGTVNLAAVGSTLTVTDSLVTANSHIMVTLASDPGVALSIWTVGSAGSFTINTRPATVNQVAIDFLVVGAD